MHHARLAIVAGLSLTTPAFAGDRIAAPPADLAQAYARPRIAPAQYTRAMAVSPDGALAAYVLQVPEEHPVADAGVRLFLATGAPAYVAQGARIMMVNVGTRVEERLCPAEGNDWDPAWSPDGSRLAFYSDRDGTARLWVYDRVDGQCRRVSERPAKSMSGAHEEPRWSPDGGTIYFPTWPGRGRGALDQALMPIAPSSAPVMAPGGIVVYRHIPGAATAIATGPASQPDDDFEARCDGTSYLAASISAANSGGRTEAAVIVDAEAQSLPGAANRHYPISYFRLSASGRWISYFDAACRRAGDATNRIALRLFAVPASGGTPVLIADGLRPPAGPDELILNYRWSPRVDELVFALDGGLWRVAFGPEGPGAPQRLGEALGELGPALHWYSGDGMMVVVGTSPTQNGPVGLAAWDGDIDLAVVPVDGGAPIHISVDRQRWSITGVVARDDRTLLQPTPTSFRLLGRDKHTGENVVLTFDWRSGSTHETWRGRGRFRGMQTAGERIVALYEDFRTPTNLFIFSRDLGGPVRLTDVAPAQRDAASGHVELVETIIPRFDGSLRTVRTAILLPEGARRGDRLPAVVWLYPGDDLTRMLDTFGAPAMGDPAYLLTSRGYAVLLTNIPTGPGGERGHVIDEIMDSLMPQVYRAADLGYIDINRLALRGQSFGGFAAAAVIARTTLFRAAIASAGAYDLGGHYAATNFVNGQPFDNTGWSEHSQPRFGQAVWSDPLRYIENSPYYLADRIRTPLLIIQGADDFTGASESGKMFTALRRLDRHVELALYQGGGHSPADFPLAQAIDQMSRTIEFLRAHLGPGWAPSDRSADRSSID